MRDIFLALLFHGKVFLSHKHRNLCLAYIAFMYKNLYPKSQKTSR